MGKLFKSIGMLFLIIFVLILGWVVKYNWDNGGWNPSWAAEQFYEIQVNVVYEGQPITISNGAVVRDTHGYSNDVYGNARTRDYSPPLFHVLEDGKILVAVTTSPRILKSQIGTEAVYEWRDVSEERINIYILDNGDRPERIELWAMYPGESDSTNRMQLKSVQSRIVNEDKRIWAAETIPWFATQEKIVQAVEKKWGYGYGDAQTFYYDELRKNNPSILDDKSRLFVNFIKLEGGRHGCKISRERCESLTATQISDEEYSSLLSSSIDTGLTKLDSILNGKNTNIRPQKNYVYVNAEVLNPCGEKYAPVLRVAAQPFVADRGDYDPNCQAPKGLDDFVSYSFSIGPFEFTQASRGKFICGGACYANGDLKLGAYAGGAPLNSDIFYRISNPKSSVFSEDYPIYMGE